MHVPISLFPGNRFQRAGVPELLLSSSGQPGRHQATVNGKRLLWFSPDSEHTTRRLYLSLPLLPAQAWESRAQRKGAKMGGPSLSTSFSCGRSWSLLSLPRCLSTVISGEEQPLPHRFGWRGGWRIKTQGNKWGAVRNGAGFVRDWRYLGKPYGGWDPTCIPFFIS